MQDVLSPLGLLHLRQFFSHRPMVVFDYDGTLAPISNDREDVWLSDLTRALLNRLSQWIPLGVVSGRSLPDLTKRLQGLDRVMLAGNHGGECNGDSTSLYSQMKEQAAVEVQVFMARLERAGLLRDFMPGVLENKRLSLTFHWRGIDAETSRKWAFEVRRLAFDMGGFRVIPGNQSLSLVPAELSDKGDAVMGLLETARRTHLVYIGDEETDEDVFRKLGAETFTGIRVGEASDSAARWFISEQSDVDRVIEVFLALVAGATAPRSVAMTT